MPKPLAAITVAAALALAGCGSSGSSSTTGSPTTAAVPASSAPATTGSSATAVGQLTPAGTTLKIGQPATIAYTDASKPNLKSTVEILPLSLEKGSAADLRGIQLDPTQQGSTPYFVRIQVRNLGTGNLSKSYVGSSVEGIDDRKQTQSSVTFIGDFPRCNETQAPTRFTHGKTFTTCETFLIPAGGSLAGVKVNAYNPNTPDKQDVTWTP